MSRRILPRLDWRATEGAGPALKEFRLTDDELNRAAAAIEVERRGAAAAEEFRKAVAERRHELDNECKWLLWDRLYWPVSQPSAVVERLKQLADAAAKLSRLLKEADKAAELGPALRSAFDAVRTQDAGDEIESWSPDHWGQCIETVRVIEDAASVAHRAFRTNGGRARALDARAPAFAGAMLAARVPSRDPLDAFIEGTARVVRWEIGKHCKSYKAPVDGAANGGSRTSYQGAHVALVETLLRIMAERNMPAVKLPAACLAVGPREIGTRIMRLRKVAASKVG